MKKFLSTILAVVMVLSSMAMVVSAETTGTITVYDANNEIVEGTYTTIDTAAAAAGVNGKIVLSAGIFEFNGRQTIQVEGVDLIGAGSDQTFIVPSTSYANASATNKKALFTISASDITVSGVSIDGTSYGEGITSTTDFIVVRINEGENIVLNDVSVKGSPKTLMSIGKGGDSPANAYVTAYNFFAEGMSKSVSTAKVYADIDVVNGELTVESGMVDAYVCEDNANTYEIKAPGHFVFTSSSKRICTTPKHIVDTYDKASAFSKVLDYGYVIGQNDAVSRSMMMYLWNNRTSMSNVVDGMKTMVEDFAGNFLLNSYDDDFENYIQILTTGVDSKAE